MRCEPPSTAPERVRSGDGRARPRRGRIVAGLLASMLLLGACGLFDDAGPDRIAYGGAPSQFGELYEPDGEGPWPVVVLVHGGSWRAGEDLSILEDAAEDLRDRGYAVWNVEYRRVGEEGGGYPGTFDDVGAAIDHLAVIAEDRPLALDRVAVVGHSAGGTLALWAGGRVTLPPDAPGAGPRVTPVAALSLAGVADLATCAGQRLVEGACAQLLGGLPSERPDRYPLTSPIERLPIGLTQTLLHGRDDLVVPVDQSERYAAAAQAAGDPVRIEVVDGANHFSLIEVDQPAWSSVVAAIDGLGLR